jgi:adenosine tuberculosinyltransferase
LPDKRALVEMYYGEWVAPVDLFIGFDKPSAFDVPLVATGSEDLYFTVTPSPYLSQRQLRAILYDHLYSRRGSDADYDSLDAGAWQVMKEYYRSNLGNTLGVGTRAGNIWYPLPQVTLPPALSRAGEDSEDERG